LNVWARVHFSPWRKSAVAIGLIVRAHRPVDGIGASGSTLGPAGHAPHVVRIRRRAARRRCRALAQRSLSSVELFAAHRKTTARSIEPSARQAVGQSPAAMSCSAFFMSAKT
jgi:hypothetical protein